MPERVLGRTKVMLPLLGLGGAASPLSRPHEEREALAIIERAFELGVRYFDTAASYGPSEERLGKILPARRSEIFLASKTEARDRDGAWRDLERSLQRLQTDALDLWQFHALARDRDLEQIFDERNGALRAAEEAREQGIVRFLGITGHYNPEIIVRGLDRYPFDTALVPINAADVHTPKPFITTVLPVARQRGTGIVAMKVPAYGNLLKPGVLDGIGEAIGYTLSQSGASCCIISANTIAQLEENIRAARSFRPLSADEIVAIERRTAAVWQESSFFRSWG